MALVTSPEGLRVNKSSADLVGGMSGCEMINLGSRLVYERLLGFDATVPLGCWS